MATPSVNRPDLVGKWTVSLADGIHVIELEHGTTTGKRVVWVDGKQVFRREWMFKLVGKEHFTVGAAKCIINIESVSGFAYEYFLEVNGKPLERFKENQSKVMKTWLVQLPSGEVLGPGGDGDSGEGEMSSGLVRVVLEKDTMDVWANGQRQETAGEFTEEGSETHFELGGHGSCIRTVSSGSKREGIVHVLLVDGVQVPESAE